MINNEIGRDDRVHLNESDIIVNEGCAVGDDHHVVRPWPQTKSDSLLHEAQTEDSKPGKTVCSKIQGAIFPMIVLGIILGLVVMLFIINNSADADRDKVVVPYNCSSECRTTLVESIPENLTYPVPPSHPSTFSAWKQLISSANQSVYIASMYWTLRNKESGTSHPSAAQGEEIFQLLQDAIKRDVEVKIVEDVGNLYPDTETSLLADLGAEVKKLDFARLVGGGVLHTKFIISDGRSFYLGSANMDWRSLTQVKELGVHVEQCDCPLVSDLGKIFDIYWKLGDVNSTIPKPWPDTFDTYYNITHPLQLDIGRNDSANVFFSSSPPPFCTESRTVDIDAVVAVINDAKKYIDIAVMDYFPTTIYMKNNIYWPVIDDALKKVVFEDNIEVRLLASYWNHTKPIMLNYLRSLNDFSNKITVRVFVVPAYGDQASIPAARVNHNKYMVTDRVAYIGTSNWSGDYFIDTAGVSMIFNQSDSDRDMILRKQLRDVFMRDWNSDYSHSVDSQFKVINGVATASPRAAP